MLAGCTSDKDPAFEGRPRPDLLLLVLDTMRLDRVAPYTQLGNELTPNLRRFADSAVVYGHARTTAPFTMPAMASLLTGQYPHHAGITSHSRKDALSPASATLAEVARSAGYRTIAVVTNPWLATPSTGFARGFEVFTSGRTFGHTRARMDAHEVISAALDVLRAERSQPLLLWLHFMDTHMPYADEAHSTRIGRDFASNARTRSRILFEPSYSAQEVAENIRAYDRAVSQIDVAFGRLLDVLDDDAIVLVVADHGESLGEHGLHFGHDFTVYDELLRVPLMLRAPGIAPKRIDTPVSILDIMPSLCALARLDCSSHPTAAPLPGLLEPAPEVVAPARVLYAATTPARRRYRCPWLVVPGLEGRLTMATNGRRKVMRFPTLRGPLYRAFDLALDPGETSDRYDPTVDADLVRGLEKWTASAARSPDDPQKPLRLPQTVLRELRELGYLD